MLPCKGDAEEPNKTRGYMTQKRFAAYLQHFDDATKAVGIGQRSDGTDAWRMLIVDGSRTHINADVFEWALDRRILMMVLPSHTTDRTQPCEEEAKEKARADKDAAKKAKADAKADAERTQMEQIWAANYDNAKTKVEKAGIITLIQQRAACMDDIKSANLTKNEYIALIWALKKECNAPSSTRKKLEDRYFEIVQELMK